MTEEVTTAMDEYDMDSPEMRAHVARIDRLCEFRRQLGLKPHEFEPWDADLDSRGDGPGVRKALELRRRMRRTKQGREILAEAAEIEARWLEENRREMEQYERDLESGKAPRPWGWKPRDRAVRE
jgi:hypothetical protein